MDGKHRNELIALSREICDSAADRLANYCAGRYCAVANDTAEQQTEDYLFVAEESAAFLFGNALALLSPESREEEIRLFTDRVRKMDRCARQKAGNENKPD